ncbi:PAS domain S-box protein [Paracoccus limosus]|uniref:histidine kinase n=1 Tax=Paracoccus limosus TaxID=913252 RepID=A0A844H3R5_9RHOB|nr:PAS domain S-box protein [Paracoccus limosus]MTH33177.1 PAS domain S-box protein [Paracoccus limosus]
MLARSAGIVDTTLARGQNDLAHLIAALDWPTCPLGPKGEWPDCLRAAVDLILPTHAQIVIFAGPDYVALYNDAHAATIGNKHPRALGRPAREGWAELWSELEQMLRRVSTTGETVSALDRPFHIDRRGFLEEVRFDFSFSPIRDARGRIHAVLCIVAETTERLKALEAERRLAAIVSSSGDAILGMDMQQRITAWNRGAEALYGYAAAEVLGRPVTLILPEDRPDEEDRIMAQIISGVRVDTHETQRRHKDGSLIDVSLTVSPIHDHAGRIIGASKIARDISGRKKSERLRQLLMGELKHRVKNVLATVQAIANQSFGAAEPEKSRAFSDRLRALGRAHDLLTQRNWESASLVSIVDGVVSAFGAERFRVTGPDMPLPPRAVVTLSMAMHELATNAAKYGALSQPTGLVSIDWGCCPEKDEFQLTWRESGGPTVKEPVRTGFGSMLIQDALAAELNGEVELEFAPEGVTCRIRAPLSATWE